MVKKSTKPKTITTEELIELGDQKSMKRIAVAKEESIASPSKENVDETKEDVTVNGEGEECKVDATTLKKKKTRKRNRGKKKQQPNESESKPSTSSIFGFTSSNLGSGSGDSDDNQNPIKSYPDSDSYMGIYKTIITINRSPTGSLVLHNSKLGALIDSVRGPINKEAQVEAEADQDNIDKDDLDAFFHNYWDKKMKEVEDSNGKMTLLHLGKITETENGSSSQKKSKVKAKSKNRK